MGVNKRVQLFLGWSENGKCGLLKLINIFLIMCTLKISVWALLVMWLIPTSTMLIKELFSYPFLDKGKGFFIKKNCDKNYWILKSIFVSNSHILTVF